MSLYPASGAGAKRFTLNFAHRFADADLSPAVPYGIATGDQIELTRLNYFVSEIEVHSATGERLSSNPGVSFFDAFEAGEAIELELPDTGEAASLHFKIGVPASQNHSDPNQYPPDHALSPLRNGMHWTWSSGYIFCAIEGYLQTGDPAERSGFSYHIANDAFLKPVSLPLPSPLQPGSSLTVSFDLAQVLTGTDFDLSNQTSTHSRPGDPVAEVLARRIQGSFSLSESRIPGDTAQKASATATEVVGTPVAFSLPKNFPIPELPIDHPLTEERIALGEMLFHSPLLSRDQSLSCASCHQAEHAFSDSRTFSIGIEEQAGRRQSMALFNLAWKDSYFWDGRAATLREQALHPIQDPIEMGTSLEEVIARLSADPNVARQFAVAFGSEDIIAERIGIAIENFLLVQTSYQSRFDDAFRGATELTEQEKRGFELFMTEYDPRRGYYGADCFHCHGGANFSDNGFHNNGLSPTDDLGQEEFTGESSDRRLFATPSLRNVALTAPYMHDGRFQTLSEVVEHYNSGIQNAETLDPNLAKHPAAGLGLSESDKAALVAFLEALTDPSYRSHP